MRNYQFLFACLLSGEVPRMRRMRDTPSGGVQLVVTFFLDELVASSRERLLPNQVGGASPRGGAARVLALVPYLDLGGACPLLPFDSTFTPRLGGTRSSLAVTSRDGGSDPSAVETM